MTAVTKADEILHLAQKLIQTRGYNGFSFRDLAEGIGIKSASIHYHFPTKADLVLTVASKYREGFSNAVAEMQEEAKSPVETLKGYANLFQSTLNKEQRICLCGMLASEVESLPEVVRQEVALFFHDQEDWLTTVLKDGIANGEIQSMPDTRAGARMILSTLEGAMIIARSTSKPGSFAVVSEQLLSLIKT